MGIPKKTGFIKTVLRATICAASMGVAANISAQEAEGESQYEGDMKQGLHLNASQSSGSLLAEAARSGASVVISADSSTKPVDSRAKSYTVKNGDTLWDICTDFFGDPYVWPRIWSYNTKITNPHWIYPGETVWLVPPTGVAMNGMGATGDNAPVVRQTRNDAILHRNRGYVDKKILERSGTLRGAQKEVSLLSQYDEAYVEFPDNEDIQVGDEFAAFEVLREIDSVEDPGTEMGKLVEILGVVRVTNFDKDKKIARVVIDESIKPITRGTMIGPVHRRFELVPSAVNQKEMKAYVIAHLAPTLLYSTQDVVFVDKGKEEGVQEGNRFFAIKKRDTYKESLNKKDDHKGYPFEVLAEMRVLEVRPHTSTCLVTASTRALEDGAELEMVKGY